MKLRCLASSAASSPFFHHRTINLCLGQDLQVTAQRGLAKYPTHGLSELGPLPFRSLCQEREDVSKASVYLLSLVVSIFTFS